MGVRIFDLNRWQEAPEKSYINLSTIFSEGATEPSPRTFLQEALGENNSLRYKALLDSQNIPYDSITDVIKTLQEKYDESFFDYLDTYAFGTVFKKTVIEMWNNPFSMLGYSIQRNLIDTVLLRQQTGQPTARFDTGISAFPLTEEEAQIRYSDNYDPLLGVETSIVYNWFYWGLLVPVSIGLITSSFVILPSMEIFNEARELQLMTGVSGCVYFGTHFIFDLLFYLVPMAAIYLGFAVVYHLSSNTQEALSLLILSSAPVNILLPYVISEHSTDSGTAYAVNLGLFAIAGPGTVLAYLVASGATKEQDIRLLFSFSPHSNCRRHLCALQILRMKWRHATT
ncbi:hypothetical protein MTO96_001828 [Rhipicephalus appendiculatus]